LAGGDSQPIQVTKLFDLPFESLRHLGGTEDAPLNVSNDTTLTDAGLTVVETIDASPAAGEITKPPSVPPSLDTGTAANDSSLVEIAPVEPLIVPPLSPPPNT
jgi:hypothetical protein